MKKVDLYLESASDYRITQVDGAKRSTITPERARELYEQGRVHDCNMAFERLVEHGFDVDAVKSYYADLAARRTGQARNWNPKLGITQGL